jgi:Serine dehydrogenase proteinase
MRCSYNNGRRAGRILLASSLFRCSAPRKLLRSSLLHCDSSASCIGDGNLALLAELEIRKPVAEVDDQTLILADQAEKAMSQVRESIHELLADKCPQGKAEELARLLSEGTWT